MDLWFVKWCRGCAVFLLLLGLLAGRVEGQDNAMPLTPDATGAVRAPELEPNEGWLNTDKPLKFSGDLKGRVVLLDFWTYCCINCIHILPDLEYLEKKYANEPVAIIGVHSAKFENEASRETIRAAIQRYNIHHPVVIDKDMGIWDRYTAQGWPTFVLIDSRGRVVGMDSGEGHREELDAAIGKLLAEGRAAGTLTTAPLNIRPDVPYLPTGDLAFPGKILADGEGGRLFVSDSNHNRIIISTLPDADGRSKVMGVIGSGGVGAKDGSFSEASFHNPQGLALKGEKLFVADTDNHLIRQVDLTTSKVMTLTGTGKQGYDRQGGGSGTAQIISSPWDVAIGADDQLYIAMAGLHQIWKMDLTTGRVGAFAGNGRENILDGQAKQANFAQPSGLALVGGQLYVADSEVSGIRSVNTRSGKTDTLIGRGLFVFGDQDGPVANARLQHALGVTPWKGNLLVADTYNHKIKVLDLTNRTIRTLAGTGKPGAETSGTAVSFFEPGGVSTAGNHIYIADTNNHRIVKFDPEKGTAVQVQFQGFSAPQKESDTSAKSTASAIPVPSVVLSPETTITLELNAELSAAAHISAEAPMYIKVMDGERSVLQQTLKTDALPVELSLAATDLPATGTLTVTWSFAWCREGNAAVCIPARQSWAVPVSKAAGGETHIKLQAKPGIRLGL